MKRSSSIGAKFKSVYPLGSIELHVFTMIEIKRYTTNSFEEWNQFLQIAANSTFLLHRNFVEYHSDRFTDCSLLFYKKGKLVALLAGNTEGEGYYSHQGLSYGGLIYQNALRLEDTIACFEALTQYAEGQSIKTLYYKPVPTYHHSAFVNSDVFLLQKLGAKQHLEASSVIDISNALPFQQRRKRAIGKARKNQLEVKVNTEEWEQYWAILTENLKEQHGVSPTHSTAEIKYLKQHFPQQIQLQTCWFNNTLVAGVVLFLNSTTVHAQYIASTKQGRALGALDFLLDYLLRRFQYLNYFSLGVNDLRNTAGNLNNGLNDWKEGFGARVWQHYHFTISFEQLKGAKSILK